MKKANVIAAMVGQDEIDYSTFNRDIEGCCHWLQKNLLLNENRIAISLRHDYWHWIAILALMRLGKTCASIYSPQKLSSATQASFSTWLTDSAFNVPATSRALELHGKIIREYSSRNLELESSTAKGKTEKLELQFAPDAKRLIFTSGTTGNAKCVALSSADIHDRLDASESHNAQLNMSELRLLQLMGIDTVGALVITLKTWMSGGMVLMGVPSEHGSGNTQLPATQSNLLSVSPARLKELLDKTNGVWPGRDQRLVRVGGSRLHPLVRDAAVQRVGYQVETIYGSTELGLVAGCDAKFLDLIPGCAGQLYDKVEVQVVNHQDEPLPFGQQGIVRCKTPGMAKGYEGEDSAEQFRDGWFYPGDVGTLTAEGWLNITGRDTDVINLGGLKLSALDLETQLMHIDGLNDVCVVGLDLAGQHALAVAAVYAGSDLQVLRTGIEQCLPKNQSFHLVQVPALQRNAMGKLPRGNIARGLAMAIEKRLPKSAAQPPLH